MTCDQLVQKLEEYIVVIELITTTDKDRREELETMLATKIPKPDRALILGLAFGRFKGKLLAVLVDALVNPREQRAFITVAKKRICESKNQREITELTQLLNFLGNRHKDLQSAIQLASEPIAVL